MVLMFNRYNNTDKIIVDENVTYGSYSGYSFINYPKNRAGIMKIPVELQGRPDAISSILYADPSLYWVLIEYNNVKNTLNWPKVGEVIKYPPEDVVLRELL